MEKVENFVDDNLNSFIDSQSLKDLLNIKLNSFRKLFISDDPMTERYYDFLTTLEPAMSVFQILEKFEDCMADINIIGNSDISYNRRMKQLELGIGFTEWDNIDGDNNYDYFVPEANAEMYDVIKRNVIWNLCRSQYKIEKN